MQRTFDAEAISEITRPEPVLLWYYIISSLATVIFFPFVFLPLLVRFLTLHYRFDAESIRKSYGFLFKKEDLVQYSRIQDLHLRRNLLQRWMGLATIEIQTAASSTAAEMTIEGLTNFDELRDFFYSRMRGGQVEEKTVVSAAEPDDPVALLTEIRDEIRLLRGCRQ